ncbi:MAG: Dam family site-specific DNA-(adenine-N6)-methyltransferase [Candidatus Bathyarchaeota archaeon]|nr:Dam family site-specific DNA-(adenine-N6)-methyltransferase [Candidatus Bathyarchaeota archaeon]
MRPLLKWAGGKRRLVEKILGLLPRSDERSYHEPFVGGGAVFFNLEPTRSSINDINHRLMNFYRVVRDSPDELIEVASQYRYEKEEYYERRSRFNEMPEDPVEDAGLLLYLNKTGYNGLYRVNSKGLFNVPFGRYKDPRIVNVEMIHHASRLLRGVNIVNTDFGYILNEAEAGDQCYLDPPYVPVSKTASFVDYSVGGFKETDQERLRDICVRLDEMDVTFVQSNSDTELIKSLYKDTGFNIIPLRTSRLISSKVSSRASGYEVLITNSQV